MASMLLFEKIAESQGINPASLKFYTAMRGKQYNSSMAVLAATKLELKDPSEIKEEYVVVLDTTSRRYACLPKHVKDNVIAVVESSAAPYADTEKKDSNDSDVLAVIDHHAAAPGDDFIHGKFEDIRKTASCASILYEYLTSPSINWKIDKKDELERKLATAMVFGLFVDTGNPAGLTRLNLPSEDWKMLNDVREIYDAEFIANVGKKDYDISLYMKLRDGDLLSLCDGRHQVLLYPKAEDDITLSQMANVATWFGGLDTFMLLAPLSKEIDGKKYSLKGRSLSQQISIVNLMNSVFPNDTGAIRGRREMGGGYISNTPQIYEITERVQDFDRKIGFKK